MNRFARWMLWYLECSGLTSWRWAILWSRGCSCIAESRTIAKLLSTFRISEKGPEFAELVILALNLQRLKKDVDCSPNILSLYFACLAVFSRIDINDDIGEIGENSDAICKTVTPAVRESTFSPRIAIESRYIAGIQSEQKALSLGKFESSAISVQITKCLEMLVSVRISCGLFS